MAYNEKATRNLVNIRLKVLKISKDLENKKVALNATDMIKWCNTH